MNSMPGELGGRGAYISGNMNIASCTESTFIIVAGNIFPEKYNLQKQIQYTAVSRHKDKFKEYFLTYKCRS